MLDDFIADVGITVNPFEVGSEIISSRPYLVLATADIDVALVSVANNYLVGVYASRVAVEVVRGTEPIGPGTAWHSAVMRLCVPLLMLPIG